MKNILPLITVLLVLGACDNTKMQLRAPQSQVAETKTDSVKATAKDTAKADSTRILIKK